MDSVKQCDIVIVNWNSGIQLDDCIKALDPDNDDTIGKLVVVDNSSSDGSHNINTNFIKPKVIEAGENLGFGKACNLGSQECMSDYLLFLNPDTRVQRGTIGRVLAFMEFEAASHIGICGIRLYDESGMEQRHCARFPSAVTFIIESLGLSKIMPNLFPSLIMSDFDHQTDREVDHVIGAFYMIKRSLFNTLKGFDEDFFVYLEDLDLSFRANQAGQSVYYLARESAFHKGGGSSENVKAQRLAYSLSSKIIYAKKHFGCIGRNAVHIIIKYVEPLVRFVQLIIRGRLNELSDLRKGYRLLWTKH